MVTKFKKVLILSPHTDDAELGAGGTIIRLLDSGVKIKWIVFSTAEDSVPAGFDKDSLKNEFIEVTKDLKLERDQYDIYNFKVRYLHKKRQEILEILVNNKKSFQPDLVIGPSQNDVHQDHQIVSNEMIRAFKNESTILAYELPWNHFSFNSQCFIELDEKSLRKKLQILKNYKTQLALKRSYFSNEALEGLARIRGSQSSCEYAESFEVVKWLVRK